MTLAIILLIVLVALAGFIWQQTKTKGRWGLSLAAHKCPRCGTALPFVRKPSSVQQGLWGGWTCPACGCKVDKYGREIAP
jgi:hypothetical protein